ncbi:hypothetical protein NITGR_590023 [Nitrospina gracilis 3/211]|uniref:Uncharacterized protein n=1 Tax=Nitrospina gracilis (strain 3/211) TaxID=1266370 RepID=M1YZJ2_NITG3|nr:hypothetical protein NITGR_590023 [Nitrospina gracilis 3/211]
MVFPAPMPPSIAMNLGSFMRLGFESGFPKGATGGHRLP